ncbi:hypothetical protein BSU00_01545 [Tenacibaculum sp. SG-28]|nr:hypothetical protein BSU00_01545 [Tenacibaculum sp. SG-28]
MFYSCTDESKFANPATYALERGGFAQFQEGVAPNVVSFVDPSTAGFTRTIEDANNNLESYSLDFTATFANGTTQTVEDYFSTDTFPATLNVTAENIAAALGKEISELDFGDNFQFIAKAVRNDGTIFSGSAPGLNDDGSVTTGGTEANLLLPVYRNAMNFDFTFACPAFTPEDFVGTWNVDALGFATFFGETQTTREIIAGPGENQITIVGGEYPTAGGAVDDLILTFDASGIVTAVNEDGFAFGPGNNAGLTPNTYLLENGLLLPCVNKINLTMNFSPFSANPHPFELSR